MDAQISIEAPQERVSREGLEGPERALLLACEKATERDQQSLQEDWSFPETSDSRF